MRRRTFLSAMLAQSGVGFVLCGTSGCGTILHPERRGQPHNHQIDWKVAALDGLGLVLFFVPGVIAFAVDFYTGAIYLPPHPIHPGYGAKGLSGPQLAEKDQKLQRIDLPKQPQNVAEVERFVSTQVGRDIELNRQDARVSEMAEIDEFDQRLQQHQMDKSFGHSLRNFFSFPKRLGGTPS